MQAINRKEQISANLWPYYSMMHVANEALKTSQIYKVQYIEHKM
jgi:hypothetical protein